MAKRRQKEQTKTKEQFKIYQLTILYAPAPYTRSKKQKDTQKENNFAILFGHSKKNM